MEQKVIDVLVILFLAFLLIWALYPVNSKDYRYTVATVTSIEAVLDGGPIANISYSVNRKLYEGWINSHQGSIDLHRGERIFFKYYIPDPNRGEFVFEKQVSDTLKVIPSNGWAVLY